MKRFICYDVTATGWISKGFLQFCFCKTRNLCVGDSREMFVWKVLVFTGQFWFLSLLPLHWAHYGRLLAPSFSDSFSVLQVLSSSRRGAAHHADQPAVTELHRSQFCPWSFYSFCSSKYTPSQGELGFRTTENTCFPGLDLASQWVSISFKPWKNLKRHISDILA